MPSLIFTKEDGNEVAYEFENEDVGIGRHPDNEIPLDDVNVSAYHARLNRADDGYEITDTSSNGTKVNGERIETARLRHGDRIQFGPIEVVYEDETEPPPPEIAKMHCRSHPDRVAEERCAECRESFCPDCLTEVRRKKYCPACKVMAEGSGPVLLEHDRPPVCPEAKTALILALVSIFCGGILVAPFAISKALSAKRTIADDPRLGGSSQATAALVIGMFVVVVWIIALALGLLVFIQYRAIPHS